MKRAEAEAKIMGLLVQINDVKKEYYEEDEYLTLWCGEDVLSFHNSYWEHPTEGVLRRTLFLEEEGGEKE